MTKSVDAVFEIIEISNTSPTIWVVRGLSYKQLSIGDTVRTSATNKYGDSAYVQIREITIYGRKVVHLGEGYTGQLILEGNSNDLLQQSTHLLELDDNQSLNSR